MKMGAVLVMLAGCLGVLPALAGQRGQVPAQVATYARQMAETCQQAGGKPGASPNLAQRGDLNGDGITDWAIDEGGFDCEGAPSLFGGTGGSQVVVFIGTPNGGTRQVFEHGAFGMRMERAGHGEVLWLVVGGPMCGQQKARSRADMMACDRPLVWDAQRGRMDFAPISQVRRPSRIID